MGLTNAPIPDVRVDWRGDGHNAITNDIFDSDTSGWSVAAGINAAATSITRVTTGTTYGYFDNLNRTAPGTGRSRAAELVTTSTSNSGAKYIITGTFASGRTYRFSVYLARVSGTTAGKILIGSLGTVGDRAQATMTLTTGWVRYTVDWTPSGSRTDVQVTITNNAASALTVRIARAEVYEAFDDVSADVDGLTTTMGANFDGSSAGPGTASIHLRNYGNAYDPANGSSPLAGLLRLNRAVLIRADDTANGRLYAVHAGVLRRLIPDPGERMATLETQDALYALGRAEVSVAGSVTRNLSTFRADILTAAGVAAANQDIVEDGSGIVIPYTGVDQQNALDALTRLNEAQGAIHYIAPRCSSAIGWAYSTHGRLAMEGGAAQYTWNDDVTGMSGWDLTDEAVVNQQRVTPHARVFAPTASVVWTHDAVPFTVPASTTVTVWADFDGPVLSAAVSSTATNSPTVVLTAFGDSAKITITAGGSASTVSALTVSARASTLSTASSALVEDTASQAADQYGVRAGSPIESDYIASTAEATGVGGWIVYRYKAARARPTVSLQDKYGTTAHQLTFYPGRAASLTYPLLSLSADRVIVQTVTHRCTPGITWTSDIAVEEAPAVLAVFTLDSSLLNGSDVLGY